jgi:Fe-S-cluster containining protein
MPMGGPSRRERRAQKSADARVARHALPLFPDTATRQAIRIRYTAALRSGTPQSKVLDEAHHEADDRAARVFARAGAPACGPGCSYCCKLFVSVRAPEARRLAAALRALPAARLAEVRRRLAENAARVKGSTSESYPRVPCALLTDEGTCVAYEARPFSCRDYHSFDVDACRKVDVGEAPGVPSHREAAAVHGEVAMAWLEALAASGTDTGSYELQQVLHILLEDPHGDITPARETSP